MVMMSEEIEREIAEAREMRAKAERETRKLVAEKEQVLKPMWERLGIRRVQNSFGEEYEISLQVRGTK